MFEKVNPSHPDKIADRIAGAIVDLAYSKEENPKVAVEVLIGHGYCFIITESSVWFLTSEIQRIVKRVTQDDSIRVDFIQRRQDEFLAKNQEDSIKCGDNGIFKGMPITPEQRILKGVATALYENFPFDGKYILADNELIICQSNASAKQIADMFDVFPYRLHVNPLGDWTGGTDVDTGATNRKLGSDMGYAVTGGGLHGKDLSKADVSVNIYAHLKAQETGKPVELHCAIGDDVVDGIPYSEIVDIARQYIEDVGGFEKFAEWGLI